MENPTNSRKSLTYFFLLLILTWGGLGCQSPDSTSASARHTLPKDSTKQQEFSAPENLPLIMPPPDYDTSEWLELQITQGVLLDLRYASKDNFVDEQLYDCGRCFLRPQVAKALLRAQSSLQSKGLSFKLFDCYRPRQVQERLWEKVPNASYVTPPAKGSMHNRGMAVDLTLVDSSGQELPMGTPFDFFGPEAHHTYKGLSSEIQANRQLLKSTMLTHGFGAIRTEWWHYSYRGQAFPLDTMRWKCDEH